MKKNISLPVRCTTDNDIAQVFYRGILKLTIITIFEEKPKLCTEKE
jgi:hypothetical protein